MNAYAIIVNDKYINLELHANNYYDEVDWYEVTLDDKDFYITTSKSEIEELLCALENGTRFQYKYIEIQPTDDWFNRVKGYKIVEFNLVKEKNENKSF